MATELLSCVYSSGISIKVTWFLPEHVLSHVRQVQTSYLNFFVGNQPPCGFVPEMSFRLKVIITSGFIQKELYFLLVALFQYWGNFFFSFSSHPRIPTIPFCCFFHLFFKHKWDHTCTLSWNTLFPFYTGNQQMNHPRTVVAFFLALHWMVQSCHEWTYPDFCHLLFSTKNSTANSQNSFKQSLIVLCILCYWVFTLLLLLRW